MSHAIVSKVKEGKNSTAIHSIEALKIAVEAMGLEFRDCEPRKGHYRTWKDKNGGWVGDWPLPEGVSADEMGDNADYVISVPASLDPHKTCYELGIVWDEADQCWYPAHDFYAGGNGLERYIGATTVKGQQVVKSHQTLMGNYRLAQTALRRRALGQKVELTKQKEKLVLYIQ